MNIILCKVYTFYKRSVLANKPLVSVSAKIAVKHEKSIKSVKCVFLLGLVIAVLGAFSLKPPHENPGLKSHPKMTK